MPVKPRWVDDIGSGLAVMGGNSLRSVISDGRVSYIPLRYSALPRMLATTLRPEIAVVSARPHGLGFKFGLEVGYGFLAARLAAKVVIEVDSSLPNVPGAPLVPTASAHVIEAQEPAPDWNAPTTDETDRAIGRLMASLVPAGATVQYGPGSIGHAAIDSLSSPVHVHSGIVTEAVANLAKRGLLIGQATTAYLVGGPPLRALAEAGHVRLVGIDQTHSPAELARLERFVALNTALSVGLDGGINVERAGDIQVGGIGGHPDFAAAAVSSSSGLSIVGLRSSHRGVSNVVPVAHPISTGRDCVDIVVTEHGIADLRGLDDKMRAQALIAVAHPTHQDGLQRQLRERTA